MYDKIEKETLAHKTSVLNWEHKLKFVLTRVTRLFGSITRRYVYSSERPSIRAYIFRSSLLSSLPFVNSFKSIEKKYLLSLLSLMYHPHQEGCQSALV